MNLKQRVVIAILGNVKDARLGPDGQPQWRPTVSIVRHPDLAIDRLELLREEKFAPLAEEVASDIQAASPQTLIRRHTFRLANPWDFEEVYGALHDFARSQSFDPEREEYLVHITTGTHVERICLFLLTESHYLPGKLLQTRSPEEAERLGTGQYTIIDLDLSKYDRLASRFRRETCDDVSRLKSGIDTRNKRFNEMIERIEQVAGRSHAPILLTGPTGAGKSLLARRIYELKKVRQKLAGPFVEVNCATLRGDAAMSALFGHVKGAFTGAIADRPGLLKTADGGMLLLDEVGELGLDEQAMLLRALEEKRFLPVGADREIASDFQLICGTNRDLAAAVAEGVFRDDLMARINLWTFELPSLKDRPEDIEPNLDFELDQVTYATGDRVTLNREARDKFLAFAVSAEALWLGNFRDLNGALVRMATFASAGRITTEIVADEIARLKAAWSRAQRTTQDDLLHKVLGERLAELDEFDRTQLAGVLHLCAKSRTLAEAGRALFGVSRLAKARPNDSDRLRKYLARFGLTWNDVVQ